MDATIKFGKMKLPSGERIPFTRDDFAWTALRKAVGFGGVMSQQQAAHQGVKTNSASQAAPVMSVVKMPRQKTTREVLAPDVEGHMGVTSIREWVNRKQKVSITVNGVTKVVQEG